MDADTVSWIRENGPDFQYAESLPALSVAEQDFLTLVTLPSEWLLNADLETSLHGIRHGLRCAIYGVSLAKLGGELDEELRASVIACAIHDMRREDDSGDEGHGARTARWFKDNRAVVLSHFNQQFDDALVGRMCTAIHLHDIPYDEFSEKDNRLYARAKLMTDIVKTADALDRFRLPKLKWWPNLSLVRLMPPAALLKFAYHLTVISEENFVECNDSRLAVARALETTGAYHGLA